MSAMQLVVFGAFALLAAKANAYVPFSHQVLCSRLKPISVLDNKHLEGPWLTVETLLLKNGYPEAQEDSRSRVCIRTSIFDANEAGFSMRSEVRMGSDRRRTGVTKLTVGDILQPGRLTLMAKRPSTLNAEMMVLGVRSSEFLVLAYCQPTPMDDELDEDRPALWVKLLARPSAHGGVAISSRELHSLRNKIAEMLSLSELNSVRYDTSC